MNRGDPSSKILDVFRVENTKTFGRLVTRAELIEHIPGPDYPEHRFWAIKIWRRHVEAGEGYRMEQQFPSQVHVGQEKYIRRLWAGYKRRNGV